MSFSSSELNFIVWKYLQESGFAHTAFTFAQESNLHDSSVDSEGVTTGALTSIVQKGLFYAEAEVCTAIDADDISDEAEKLTLSGNLGLSLLDADFVSSCLSTPCLNGGVCSDSLAGHRCRCTQPFHGPFCQFDASSWGYHWTIVEVSLFLLVVFLVLCAVAMIFCSYTNSMGVYVTVPNKRYSRWEDGEADEEDDEDVIALGELKRASMRSSTTRETMIDPEVGCSNPCLEGPVML